MHQKNLPEVCKNCHQPMKGHFCSNCGQATKTEEIDFHYFLHQIQHGLFHLDKGILYTIKQMFIRPGHSIREYIEGKRVKHYKPIAFIFFTATVYVLLVHFVKENTFLDGISVQSGDKQPGKIDVLGTSFNWLKNHYAIATLMFIPILSLSSFWAFRKSGYNYFKHIVLNSFIAGQRTVLYIILVPILKLISDPDIKDIFQNGMLFLGIVLTFWAFLQFFDKYSKTRTFFLTILTYCLFVFLIFLIIFVAAVMIGIVEKI
jgi:hypothetical protein